jgi:hypothetical protein
MRFIILVAIAFLHSISLAVAQPPWTKQNIPPGYTLGNDGCPHRTPPAVLQGKERIACTPNQGGAPPPPVTYITASPAQVLAALECDFADAVKATKGKPTDLATAVMSGSIKFAFVTKKSSGASLAVAAIPVFSSALTAPSLEASRLTDVTYSDEWTIKIDPKAVSACANPSSNKWLTSKVVLGNPGHVKIEKFVTKVSFVLTTKGGAGLNLNIVPISIGPKFSSENSNSQSLDLTIDYQPPKEAPAETPIAKKPTS